MAKLVFTIDMPPHSGNYEIEMPPSFTMREERILKQMADIVSGEWIDELNKGSISAMAATALIAMRRAGVVVHPRAFEDVDPDKTFKDVQWHTDPEDDDSPLAPDSNSGQNENKPLSSEDGRSSSTPTPENTSRPSTGVPV